METLKSWKFWVATVSTASIGLPPVFFGPVWLGGIVLGATLGVFAFYLKYEMGTFLVPWFTKMGIFGGYAGEEVSEEPGRILRGLALGSLFIWVIPIIVEFVLN